jgi:hypothetical protein
MISVFCVCIFLQSLQHTNPTNLRLAFPHFRHSFRMESAAKHVRSHIATAPRDACKPLMIACSICVI